MRNVIGNGNSVMMNRYSWDVVIKVFFVMIILINDKIVESLVLWYVVCVLVF